MTCDGLYWPAGEGGAILDFEVEYQTSHFHTCMRGGCLPLKGLYWPLRALRGCASPDCMHDKTSIRLI